MEYAMKKLQVIDWVLIVLSVLFFVGCVFEFQRRNLLLYFCIPLFLCLFLLTERRIGGKYQILKKIPLLLVTLFLIYSSIVFNLTSSPLFGVRDKGSENYLIGKDYFQQVSIPTMSGLMHGWLYRKFDEKAPLIIFFNGAGECAAETVAKFYKEEILSNYFPEYNFLCTDYPGYGLSEGKATEATMKKMALDTFDTAIQWDFVDPSNVTAIGYSIGTGTASYLAAQRDLDSCVLLAPYEKYWDNYLRNLDFYAKRSVEKVKRTSGLQKTFFKLIWGYNVNPYDYAPSIEEPVLIIASTADTTIIHEASVKVADRISSCELVTLTEIKHEYLLCDETYKVIRKFLRR